MIANTATDREILTDLGNRLARHRLELNLSQAEVAREGGLSVAALQRLEGGHGGNLRSLIHAMRVLGLADELPRSLPDPSPGPLELLERGGQRRRRATPRSRRPVETAPTRALWPDELPSGRA